jgi:hypothetical protein
MRRRVVGSVTAVALAAVFAVGARLTAGQAPARPATQAPAAPRPAAPAAQAGAAARMTDGKPNFNGVWQALNEANWDIQDHNARMGPVVALGAAYSVPPGLGIVEGNEIPYKPEALAKKKANMEHALTLDPEIKCFMPGVPRAMYMPYPFLITQSSSNILMTFEFAAASRTVFMDSKPKAPVDSWMGWSIGHWEGDTLVIVATDFVPGSWFDRAGNHHTDALKVTERYTANGPNVINYEATIEDPNVFTKPWKIGFPLYRRLEKNAQLLEYKCVEFAEELMYGHLKKKTQ